jgi:hypothetical protein
MDTKAKLLAAIYTAFTKAGKVRDDDFLSTQALLSALKEDFAWAAVRPGDNASLAKASWTLSKFLSRYGIRPVRKGRVRVRGYRRGQFREVWAKYGMLPPDDPVYPVTSASAAGMTEELPPTTTVRRRRKYHLGKPEDRFIGAVLYALDFMEADIARVLGKDRATISRWKRQPVSVPEGWGKRGRWKSWEAFRSAFGPPTPLAVARILAEEPFALAVQEALRRASANDALTLYIRLEDMVKSGIGDFVLRILTRLPCPRCRQAVRPLDRARIALLHKDCFRQTFQPDDSCGRSSL